jgi:polyphosphate glucokinase
MPRPASALVRGVDAPRARGVPRRILPPVSDVQPSDPTVQPRDDLAAVPAEDAHRLDTVSAAAPGPVGSGRPVGVALGIDVGGTGVKAAVVDLSSGQLVTDRVRRPTPKPATPSAVADTIAEVIGVLAASGRVTDAIPVGIGLPGVVKNGRLMTAANIDPAWTGSDAERIIGERIGRKVIAVNDADAAGVAELLYGAAAGRAGTVLLLTIGTGIGTAIFVDGHLVPNAELGHIELNGKDAETQVSGVARERRKLSWKAWAKEFNQYLDHMEFYLWPDLIILGGGVSKSIAKYEKFLATRAELVPAKLLNLAGIVGAAAFAAGAAQQRTQGSPE